MMVMWLGNIEKQKLEQGIVNAFLAGENVKTIFIVNKHNDRGDKYITDRDIKELTYKLSLSSKGKERIAKPEHVSNNISKNDQAIKDRVIGAINTMLKQDHQVFILQVDFPDTGIYLAQELTKKYGSPMAA